MLKHCLFAFYAYNLGISLTLYNALFPIQIRIRLLVSPSSSLSVLRQLREMACSNFLIA
jgi:hypothetical protein